MIRKQQTTKVYLTFLLCMTMTLVVCALTLLDRPTHTRRIAFPIAQSYPCVHYQHNKIQLYGDPSRWHNLLDQMSALAFDGQGKIDILHIGGSHVQGGFLSDRMRDNLSQLFYGAAGERGFFFPYSLAKSNGQRSVKCDHWGSWRGCRNSVSDHACEWGMSGINAITENSNAGFELSTVHLDSIPQQFDEVRIYSTAGAANSFDLTVQNARLDSTTLGQSYRRYVYASPQTVLRVQLMKTDSLQHMFALQGIYLGEAKNGISYHTIGVNGASTRSYLRCAAFEGQMATIAPDLVICGIGVNDANVPSDEFDAQAYQMRYDSLIHTFQVANPNVCLLFVTNNDTYYQKRYSNPNAIKIRESMIALAQKHNGAVYDLYQVMGGANSIRAWADAGLAANDYIHFSKRGYELQADMMTAALAEMLGNHIDQHQH
jgi:lysophospholipase L1-like esterase